MGRGLALRAEPGGEEAGVSGERRPEAPLGPGPGRPTREGRAGGGRRRRAGAVTRGLTHMLAPRGVAARAVLAPGLGGSDWGRGERVQEGRLRTSGPAANLRPATALGKRRAGSSAGILAAPAAKCPCCH